jgi:aromatic ring hydroxylase
MVAVIPAAGEAGMRGSDTRSGELFSYIDLEQRVPAKHPLRKIRQLVNDVLVSLDAEFAKLYSAFGRGSIRPERLEPSLKNHHRLLSFPETAK